VREEALMMVAGKTGYERTGSKDGGRQNKEKEQAV
jgi:hypothetical protein